jgi:hypothetical protein
MQKLLLAAALLAASGTAHAGVTLISSQAAFDAAGTISQNTNWDSYGTGWSFPGSPFTVGDLSFVEGGQNLIGGIDGYGMLRALFTDNYVAGTTINIAGSYSLFGLNAANFFSADTVNFTVTTNAGEYFLTSPVLSGAGGGALTFVGFRADAGEYFTSVNVYSPNATGFTDVQLGVAGVPEPASWAMLIAGFGLVGATMRRRSGRVARTLA